MNALLQVLLHSPFDYDLAEGVDVRESCWNTSIMRVRVTRVGSDGGKVGPVEATMTNGHEVNEITNGTAEQAQGRWRGEVLSWGDVRHLEQEGEWEDVEVADDIKG